MTEIISPIHPDMTINEVIRARPATVRVFDAHGMDSCCGGNLALAAVADRHGVDLKSLLQELDAAAEGGSG